MNGAQPLREIVELADVAVRAASQLRQRQAGRELSDRASIELTADFLERATKGGWFLSEKANVGTFDDTLLPLNWATDTYLAQYPLPSPKRPDYSVVAKYLDGIRSSLLGILANELPSKDAYEKALEFVERLAGILAARADLDLRTESRRAQNASRLT